MGTPRLNLRERDVLEVVQRLGQASADDIRAEMPDPPSNSAVRTHLRILEDKGHVRREKDGRKYLYLPTVGAETAGRTALLQLVRTFFADEPEKAVSTLLRETASDLSKEHLDHLDALIQHARKEAE